MLGPQPRLRQRRGLNISTLYMWLVEQQALFTDSAICLGRSRASVTVGLENVIASSQGPRLLHGWAAVLASVLGSLRAHCSHSQWGWRWHTVCRGHFPHRRQDPGEWTWAAFTNLKHPEQRKARDPNILPVLATACLDFSVISAQVIKNSQFSPPVFYTLMLLCL